jgi:hypothetical protein
VNRNTHMGILILLATALAQVFLPVPEAFAQTAAPAAELRRSGAVSAPPILSVADLKKRSVRWVRMLKAIRVARAEVR